MDLLWPGLHRSGTLFTDEAVIAAMFAVEAAWAAALEKDDLAPAGTSSAMAQAWDAALAAGDLDPAALAVASEGVGNPLVAFLSAIRRHLPANISTAIHKGLTSQDVVDTAMIVCSRDALLAIGTELDAQIEAVIVLAQTHRDTPALARTLTQAALPTTFGARAAGWLNGLVAARADLRRQLDDLPAQLGGAVGTLANTVAALARAGHPDPVGAATEVVSTVADELGLRPHLPWHTQRTPITRIGDLLVEISDAFGHVANDILLGSRPEAGELSEPSGDGKGGSSAMPQKNNPVLTVLIRRQAISAPLLGAQLHLGAAGAADERPDGAWHIEWKALQDLARRTLAAARQATIVLQGLGVHAEAMRANLQAALPGAMSEGVVPVLAGLLPGGRAEATALMSSPSVDDLVAAVLARVGGSGGAPADRALTPGGAVVGSGARSGGAPTGGALTPGGAVVGSGARSGGAPAGGALTPGGATGGSGARSGGAPSDGAQTQGGAVGGSGGRSGGAPSGGAQTPGGAVGGPGAASGGAPSDGAVTEADLRRLLDPTSYLGLSGRIVDDAVAAARAANLPG